MIVGKFKGLRKLAVQAIVDEAQVFGERGAWNKAGDEGAIFRVPSAGGPVGLLNERMGQTRPVDGIVHQDFEPENASDPRMCKRFIKSGHTEVGRQQFQWLGGAYRGHEVRFYTGCAKMPTRMADAGSWQTERPVSALRFGLFQKDSESGLPEMVVGCQRVGQALVLHDDERETVGQAPGLIGPLLVKGEGAS